LEAAHNVSKHLVVRGVVGYARFEGVVVAVAHVSCALPGLARVEALGGSTPRPHARRFFPHASLQRIGRGEPVRSRRVPVQLAVLCLPARQRLAAPDGLIAIAPAESAPHSF